ncbi:MAG: hypothetical protein JWR06_1013, partial [Jatrophihabitans sp.]|nr:hypothetical protein [Jatrophihabitans sp.]
MLADWTLGVVPVDEALPLPGGVVAAVDEADDEADELGGSGGVVEVLPVSLGVGVGQVLVELLPVLPLD